MHPPWFLFLFKEFLLQFLIFLSAYISFFSFTYTCAVQHCTLYNLGILIDKIK
ncbi:hypothetical protein BCR42DRAFT_410422, partial [Absidia repens]